MLKKQITKLEMLLAVAMGEYYGKTHVLFIPPNTEYIAQFENMKRKKYIEPAKNKSIGQQHSFHVTIKGYNFIKRQKVLQSKKADEFIDKFVNDL